MPASSSVAASSLAVRPCHSPPNAEPRWLWASMAGNRGRGTRWRGTRSLRPRLEVGQAQVGDVRAHPFRPLIAMPRTKTCWAATNRMIIGATLTRAPAIISGHLPTNWPWKNASPTVVVYWSSWRR